MVADMDPANIHQDLRARSRSGTLGTRPPPVSFLSSPASSSASMSGRSRRVSSPNWAAAARMDPPPLQRRRSVASETTAYPGLGHDEARLFGVGLDLLPELADMDAQILRIDWMAPDLADQVGMSSRG